MSMSLPLWTLFLLAAAILGLLSWRWYVRQERAAQQLELIPTSDDWGLSGRRLAYHDDDLTTVPATRSTLGELRDPRLAHRAGVGILVADEVIQTMKDRHEYVVVAARVDPSLEWFAADQEVTANLLPRRVVAALAPVVKDGNTGAVIIGGGFLAIRVGSMTTAGRAIDAAAAVVAATAPMPAEEAAESTGGWQQPPTDPR